MDIFDFAKSWRKMTNSLVTRANSETTHYEISCLLQRFTFFSFCFLFRLNVCLKFKHTTRNERLRILVFHAGLSSTLRAHTICWERWTYLPKCSRFENATYAWGEATQVENNSKHDWKRPVFFLLGLQHFRECSWRTLKENANSSRSLRSLKSNFRWQKEQRKVKALVVKTSSVISCLFKRILHDKSLTAISFYEVMVTDCPATSATQQKYVH